MKSIITFLLFLFFKFSFILAQEIKPQIVSTAGATMNQSNAKLSFTVGEIVVKTVTNGTNSIGQGFTNSTTNNIITAIKEPKASLLQMKVYPNPASDLIYVDISDNKVPNIQLSVYDITGKQISNDNYAAGNNHIGINTQNWQKGEYIIVINDANNEQLGSYKVVRQ